VLALEIFVYAMLALAGTGFLIAALFWGGLVLLRFYRDLSQWRQRDWINHAERTYVFADPAAYSRFEASEIKREASGRRLLLLGAGVSVAFAIVGATIIFLLPVGELSVIDAKINANFRDKTLRSEAIKKASGSETRYSLGSPADEELATTSASEAIFENHPVDNARRLYLSAYLAGIYRQRDEANLSRPNAGELSELMKPLGKVGVVAAESIPGLARHFTESGVDKAIDVAGDGALEFIKHTLDSKDDDGDKGAPHVVQICNAYAEGHAGLEKPPGSGTEKPRGSKKKRAVDDKGTCDGLVDSSRSSLRDRR